MNEEKNDTTYLSKAEEQEERRGRIKRILRASEIQWYSWKWQLTHRVNNIETLSKIINMSDHQKQYIEKLIKKYAWSVSPYYCSLMSENNSLCPIRLMSMLQCQEPADPIQQKHTSLKGTTLYPNELTINVPSECASHLRFCLRRPHSGFHYGLTYRDTIAESIEYLKNHKEIRDVLVAGGDLLTLGDDKLEWMLSGLRALSHVESIRIKTDVTVTLPMRITMRLCTLLKKYLPLYLISNYNHPIEISDDSKRTVQKLINSEIPLRNKMTIINGINNNKQIIECLNQELLKIGITPY